MAIIFSIILAPTSLPVITVVISPFLLLIRMGLVSRVGNGILAALG